MQTFTRVESFGSPHGHWVRVRVEPERPEVFSFRQELVDENLYTLVPPEARPVGDPDESLRIWRYAARVLQWTPRVLAWIGALALLWWTVRGVRRLRRRR